MSTYYNQQTGQYENFEKRVADDLAAIAGIFSEQQGEGITVVAGVRYDTDEQGLTDTQKGNARTNIGAVSQAEVAAEAVRFDESQSLTDTQKGQARTNVGAASQADMDDVKDADREVIVSGDYSATRSTRVYGTFPAGTYRIDVDSVTSSDDDADVCYVGFMNDSAERATLVFPRGVKTHAYVTISATATSLALMASYNYASSANDTFTFTGLKVTKDYPLARLENDQQEVLEKLLDKSGEATRSSTVTMSLPEGDYIVSVDHIFSSDTDVTVSTILFTDSNNNEKLELTLLRGVAQTRHIHLPANVAKFFFFAGTNYSNSNNDTIAYSNLRIWRVNKKLLTDNAIATPDGFGWTNHPLAGHLFRTEKGIECDLDVRSLRRKTGKTYYVSPNGSDSNTGTSIAPLQSIKTAMNKSDAVFVVVMDGFYTADLVPQHLSSYARSVAVVAASGAKPVLSTNTGSHTFTKTDGKTYVYETEADSNAVWDITNGVPYAWVNSIADVDSTEGSFYSDGTNTYVHVKGDGEPGTDIRCCPAADNFRVTASGAITLYIEGLTICGGDSGAFRVTCDGTNRTKVYAKNCIFVGGVDWGACYLEGCESVMRGCEACYSMADGFGIHRNNTTGTVSPRHVEIDCHGHHNGAAGDTTSNGSTVHAAGYVIRVNGNYHHNVGPNVVDVHNNTKSWNLGCHAWKSLVENEAQSNDFMISTDVESGTKAVMWLDSCSGYGSETALDVSANSAAYVRGCVFTKISVSYSGQMESY